MSTPEYVTDVPYVRTFMEELSPARLRLVAALNGFPSPAPEDFDYCDLGAAHGDTTIALAAAYPRARFVGVDINPEHVKAACSLASSGGLKNARFVERDFEDLSYDDMPDFDYMVAHGVLSWIGPEKRKALLKFASSKLKPGGLMYVGYNALPGWAAVEPLRRILADRAAAVVGDSREKARQAFDLAKRLSESGASYFTSNPSARDMLGVMEKAGLPYVVHEYLHMHWAPMYFADLAREMAAQDLYYLGQMPLYLNYRDLALTPDMAKLLQGVEDRTTFESLLGYATNQFFRRDIYVKGKVSHEISSMHGYLDTTPFGVLAPGPVARSVRLPNYTLQFTGAIFDALLRALEEGAATVGELARRPEIASFGRQTLRDAMMRLLIAGQILPLLRSTRGQLRAGSELYHIPSEYNRMILKRRMSPDLPMALASQVAGNGISLSMLQVVMIRLLTEVEAAGRPAWIRALFESQPFSLKIGEQANNDKAGSVLELLVELERFRSEWVPKLLELGVLEEAIVGKAG